MRVELGFKGETFVADLRKVALKKLAEAGVIDRFGEHIRRGLPSLVNVHPFTDEFNSKFADLTAMGGVPLVYGGHFTHLDGAVVADFCSQLQSCARQSGVEDHLRSFVMPVAGSLPNGKQDDFLQAIYPKMVAYGEERNVSHIPLTRKKDIEVYGMTKSLSEARPLVAALKQKGTGVVVFPGGSVQPGRHRKDKPNQINGLQEITGTELLDLFELMDKLGQKIDQQPYFLPIGIDRTYELQNSDNLLPTPQGLASLYYERFAWLLDIVGFQRIYVEIGNGMPLTAEDVKKELGSDWRKRDNLHVRELNTFLMRRAAQLIPPHARGFYGDVIASDEKAA